MLQERYSMATRTRQTLDYTVTGETFRFGQYDPGHGGMPCYNKTTTDVTGLGDNQDFHVSQRSYGDSDFRLNAPYQGWAAVNWTNKLVDAIQYQGTNFGHMGVSGVPPLTDLAVTAAARTTPSRPYVDAPVELLQLGDLIQDIKHIGDNYLYQTIRQGPTRQGANLGKVAQAFGSSNLSFQFNWAPLFEDVVKVLNFADQVERRIKEIKRLRDRGLRRTIKLGDLGDYETSVSRQPWNCQSFDYYIVTYYDARTRVRLGAHCRWSPTQDLSHLSPGSMRELARKAVGGYTFDGSSAWQLIPWSWLVDWGISIGDWFKSNRNIIPAQLDEVSILRHTRSEYTSDAMTIPYGSTNITLSAGTNLAEDKERIRTVCIPVAHFPFLSENQMGILGSLAITGRSVR